MSHVVLSLDLVVTSKGCRLVKISMEDGECFCIASPPDMSVTSSTSCTDDQSVKTVDMTENLHSSDENAEVSSSCEMQPSSFPTEVDLLNNQVIDAFYILPCVYCIYYACSVNVTAVVSASVPMFCTYVVL